MVGYFNSTICFYILTVSFYLEDRDNTKGAGALTREYMALINNMGQYFRIVPVKPKSNKFSRITSLITPFTYKKLYIENTVVLLYLMIFTLIKGITKFMMMLLM